MARIFNTTGPCNPADHYMIPAETRLPEVWPLIAHKEYFVLHAPRQVGKTTTMMALAEVLRAQGVAACWATLERSQGFEEVERAEPLWIDALVRWGKRGMPAEYHPPDAAAVGHVSPGSRLNEFLCLWAAKIPVPFVLLLDEADVVKGPALVSLLRQLRDGHMGRGIGYFPVSVGLIGMRDLRDYLVEAKGGRPINPGSPFNVKAESLTMRGFTAAEVGELVGQHTAETGQVFAAEAVELLVELTAGQPFLVNALARMCTMRLVPDPSVPITRDTVEQARELLILSRTTHLDSLAERLKEPRVAAIVQAVLTGDSPLRVDTDDFDYTVDLGLIRREPGGAVVANPLYREVLARQLSLNLQCNLPAPWWPWARADGGLDLDALLAAFRQWWRENSDVLGEQTQGYPEAVPHLALCAFLQRVVNGGGRIHREYAAGRGAMDLLVEYAPMVSGSKGEGEAAGKRGPIERFAIEIKRVRSRDSLETVIERGVAQLGRYLDTVGLERGWLVVFDVRPDRSWEERLWTREMVVPATGKRVLVLGA